MSDISATEDRMAARDGVHLRTLRWSTAAAAGPPVVLVHGYLEHAGRYAELAAYLASHGHPVLAFDHRGHGRSEGIRGYVRDFGDYVDDVKLVLARARDDAGTTPFLLGHSMGGLIALAYAIEHDGIRGVAVSSPYLRNAVRVSGAQRAALQVLARVRPTLQLASPLKASQLTRDAALVAAQQSDALVLRRYTPGWGLALLRAQAATLAGAPRLRSPLLVMVAGADSVADPAAARDFYERAGSTDKTLVAYDEHYHENFNELDRQRVYADLEGWLNARAA